MNRASGRNYWGKRTEEEQAMLRVILLTERDKVRPSRRDNQCELLSAHPGEDIIQATRNNKLIKAESIAIVHMCTDFIVNQVL